MVPELTPGRLRAQAGRGGACHGAAAGCPSRLGGTIAMIDPAARGLGTGEMAQGAQPDSETTAMQNAQAAPRRGGDDADRAGGLGGAAFAGLTRGSGSRERGAACS
jgi:hypothetical protein